MYVRERERERGVTCCSLCYQQPETALLSNTYWPAGTPALLYPGGTAAAQTADLSPEPGYYRGKIHRLHDPNLEISFRAAIGLTSLAGPPMNSLKY